MGLNARCPTHRNSHEYEEGRYKMLNARNIIARMVMSPFCRQPLSHPELAHESNMISPIRTSLQLGSEPEFVVQ